MIQQAIIYIESLISVYGVWGVVIATFIEEIIAPIPSALVPIAAGFFLVPSDALLAEAMVRVLFMVALPIAIGVSVGSMIVYGIAYTGGKPVIDRFGSWFGLKWESIERMQRYFSGGRKDEVMLVLLRLLPIIPGVGISGCAGVIRYPFGTFVIATFIGVYIRSILLGLLGWQAGELYQEYFETIDRIEGQLLIAFLVVLAAGAAWYFIRRQNKRKAS